MRSVSECTGHSKDIPWSCGNEPHRCCVTVSVFHSDEPGNALCTDWASSYVFLAVQRLLCYHMWWISAPITVILAIYTLVQVRVCQPDVFENYRLCILLEFDSCTFSSIV